MDVCASPASAQIDALCTASITLNFDPPARLVLPPTPAPDSTATGSGTITNCALFDGGPTTGTFTYSLEGNLTCTSAENVVGTLDVVWADNTESYAEITTLALDLGSVGPRYGPCERMLANLYGERIALPFGELLGITHTVDRTRWIENHCRCHDWPSQGSAACFVHTRN